MAVMWALQILLAMLGTVVNSVIIFIYHHYKRGKLTSTEMFMMFLAATDLTYSACVAVFGLMTNGYIRVSIGLLFIKVSIFSHALLQFQSWTLHLNITVERFLCVCKPLFHQQFYSRRTVMILTIAAAGLSLLLAGPMFLATGQPERDVDLLKYFVVIRSLFTFINVVSMATVYSLISLKLGRMHQKRVNNINKTLVPLRDLTPNPDQLQSAPEPNKIQLLKVASTASASMSSPCGSSSRSQLTHTPSAQREKERRKRDVRMTVVMMCSTAIFILLVVPQLISNIVELLNDNVTHATLEIISVSLFNLHFSVNFFVHCSINEFFRTKMASILRCGKAQEQVENTTKNDCPDKSSRLVTKQINEHSSEL